jgi:hypothetical protein
MEITVKLEDPSIASSQKSAAWYADGSDCAVYVGCVSDGSRTVEVFVDGRLRAHGPSGPIRSGDALREEYGSDEDLEIAGQCEEFSMSEEPWFVLEIAGERPGDDWDHADDSEGLWQHYELFRDIDEAVAAAKGALEKP